MATFVNRRKIAVLTAVAAALLLALLLLWPFSTSEFRDKSLLELLIDLRSEYEAPGLTIVQAAQTLKSGQAAFEFVRDRVRYSPYQGHLQEPNAVLQTRVANVHDRAKLLFALLEEIGESASLVRASNRELPEGIDPTQGLAVVARSEVVAEIGKRIGYDFGLEGSEIGQVETDLAVYAQKTETQIVQTKDLIAELVNLSSSQSLPASWNEYDRDWLWVEATSGDEVIIYDPSFPDFPRPENFAVVPKGSTAVAMDEIRLFVENRAGLREELLAWEGEAFGQDISLTFLPTQDPTVVLGDPFEPEQVGIWTPVLQIGFDTTLGEPVSVDGSHIGFGSSQAPYSPSDDASSDVVITQAEIIRIDARNYPVVQAYIDVETVDDRDWFARDFVLHENEVAQSVRIKSIAFNPRSVVAVSDVSGSMETDDRLVQSQVALQALVATLSPRTPFGLISFAGDALLELNVEPLSDGSAARDVIEGLQIRSDTALLVGLNAGLDQFEDRSGTIIMLTDGEDVIGGDLDDTLQRLVESNVEVIAIGLGDNPDETLMHQFAEASGGRYVRFTSGDNLTSIYSALGSSLSGLLAIEYETSLASLTQSEQIAASIDLEPSDGLASELGPTTSTVETSITDLRQISLTITGLDQSSLQAEYIAPNQQRSVPRLVLEITSGRPDARQSIERTITVLDGPESGWNLVGLNRIYFDLGRPQPSVVYAGYLTNWINALLLKQNDPDSQRDLSADPFSGPARTSFEYATTVVGFRTLVDAPDLGNLVYSPGPNIYLERRHYEPGLDEPVEVNSFDILQAWGRGFGEAAQTPEAMALEIAATFAEGMMVGGSDSVSPLLGRIEELSVKPVGDPAPDDWPNELRRQAMLRQSADTNWIYSPQIPSIAWEIHPESRRFRAFIDSSGLVAKGASISRVAQQFDQIDKMYAAYAALGSWGGKAAGVVGISPLIAMISAFKREENKLWCYSTIMMGYVSDAIEDPNATLNQSTEMAKASAASLCKMDYDPDQFGERAVWAAATAGAKSWGNNRFKDFMKSQGFSLGATIVDAYSNGGKIVSIGNAFLPLTPGFHSLLNSAVEANGQN